VKFKKNDKVYWRNERYGGRIARKVVHGTRKVPHLGSPPGEGVEMYDLGDGLMAYDFEVTARVL
jgi:hypothetical protein